MANDFTDSLNEFQDGIEESTEATRELSAKIGDLASKGLSYSDFAGTDKDGNDTGGNLHVTKAPTYQGEFRQQMTNYPIYPQANAPHPKQAETLALAQNIRATGDYAKSLASMQKAGKAAIGSLDLDTFSKSIRAEMSNLEGEIRKEAQALLTFVTEVQRSLGDTTTGLDKSLAEVKAMSKMSPTTAKDVVKTTQAAINRVMASTRENVTITSPTGKPVQVSATQGVRNSDIPAINQLFTSAKRMDAELAKATSNVLAYTLGGGKQRASDNFHNSQARNIGGLAKHIGAGLNIFDAVLKDPALQSNANFGQVYAQFVDIMKSTGLSKADASSMIKSAFSLHDIAKYPGDKYNPDHGGAAFDIVPKSTLNKYVAAMSRINPSLAEDLMMGISDHHYSRTGQGLMDVDSNGNLTKQGQRMAAYAREHGFKNADAARAYLQTRPGYQIIRTLDGLSAGLDDKEYWSYMSKEDGLIDIALGLGKDGSKKYTARRNAGYDAMLKGTGIDRRDVELVQKEGYKSLVRAMAYPGQADAQDRKVAEALGLSSIAGGLNNIESGALGLIRNKGRIGEAYFEDPTLGARALSASDQRAWLETLATGDASKLDWRKPENVAKILTPEVTKAMYLAGTTTGPDGKTRSTFLTNLSQSLTTYEDSFDPEVFKTLKQNVGRLDHGFRAMIAQIEGGSKDSVNFGTVFKTIEDAAKSVTVPTTRPAGPSGPINSVPGNYVTSELHKTKGTEDLEYPLKLAKMASAHGDPYKIEEAKQLLEIQKLTLGQKQEQFELGNKMLLSEQDRAKLAKVEIQQGEKAQAIAEATALKTAERKKLEAENPELYSATIQAEAQQKINNTEKTQLTNQLLQERINLINQIKMSSMSEEQKMQRINELLSSGNKTLQERNKIQQEGEMIGRDYMGRIGSKELSYGMLGLGTPKNKGGGLGGGIANLLGTNTFQLKQNALMVGSLFGAGAASTWGLLRQGTQQLKEAETAAINLGRVFNGTTADLQALQKEALSMSVQYGQSIQDISEMQEEWAKTGKDSYTEISKLTEATVLALNTSNFESAEKATKSLNSAIVQMGIGADKVIELLDSWNAVADAFPADTQDLAEAYERSGSYARSVGLDTDELNALAITIMERTGRSGAEAGTAMRAIFSNIFKDKSVKTLEGMGIQVYQRDAEGKIDNTRYRDFVDILRDAGAKYTELSAAGKTVDMVALSNALGQSRQRNFAIAAMEGMATFDEKLAISRDAEGYSQKKLDKTMESWDKKAAQLGAALQSATVALMDTGMMDVLKGLTDGLTDLFSAVNSDKGIMEEHGVQVRTVIADLILMGAAMKLINKSVKAHTTMTAPQWLADKAMGRMSGKVTASAATRWSNVRPFDTKGPAGAGQFVMPGSGTIDIADGVNKAYTRKLSAGITDVAGVNQQLNLFKNQENFYRSIAQQSTAMKDNQAAVDAYVADMMRLQTVETANIAIMDQAIAKTIARGLSTEANNALELVHGLNMESQIALTNLLSQSEGTEAAMTLEQMAAESANIQVEQLSNAVTAISNLNDEQKAAILAILNASLANNTALTADNTNKIIANTVAQKAAKAASSAWAAGITIGIMALTGLVSWLRSAKKQAEELANTRIKVYVERIETTKQAQASALTYNEAKNARDARQAAIEAQNKQAGLKEGDAGYIDYRTDESWKDYNKQTQDAAKDLYGYIPGASTGGTYVDGEYVPKFDDSSKIDEEIASALEKDVETAEYMERYWGERLKLQDQNLDGVTAWNDMIRYSPAGVQAIMDNGSKEDALKLIKNATVYASSGMGTTVAQNPYEVWLNNKYGGGDYTDEQWLEAFNNKELMDTIRKYQSSGKLYLPQSSELNRQDWLDYIVAADQEEGSGGLAKYIDNMSFWSKPIGGINYFEEEKSRKGFETMESTQAAAAIAPQELMEYYSKKWGTGTISKLFDTYSPDKIKDMMSETTGIGNLALPITLDNEDLQKLDEATTSGFDVDIASEEGKELIKVLKEGGKLDIEPAEGTTGLFLTLDQLKYLSEQGYTIPVIFQMSQVLLGKYASGEVDPDSILAAGALDRVNALSTKAPQALIDQYGASAKSGQLLIEEGNSTAEAMTGVEDYAGRADEAMDKLSTLSDRLTKGTATSADLSKFFSQKVVGANGFMDTETLVTVFKDLGYLTTDNLEDTDWVRLANDAKGPNEEGAKLFAKVFEDADKANRKTLSGANTDLQAQLQFYVDAISDEQKVVKDRLAQVNEKLKTETDPNKVKTLEAERDSLEADLASIADKYSEYNGALEALRDGETTLTTTADYDPDYKEPIDEFNDYMEKVNKSLSRFDNQVDKAMHALEKFDALNQFSSLDPAIVQQRAAYVAQANAAAQTRMSERAEMMEKVKNWEPGTTITIPGAYTPTSTATISSKWNTTYDALITKYANAAGIDPNFVKAIIKAESNFSPSVVSSAGAVGLMQIMPQWSDYTAEQLKDPETNIKDGVNEIKSYLDKYGSAELALAAYNGGPTRLDNNNRDISKMPKETRDYVPKVLGYYADLGGATQQVAQAVNGLNDIIASGHTVTSNYGVDRGDHAHGGIDYNYAMNTPVKAPISGTLSRKSDPDGFGTYATITAADGSVHYLGHLNKYDDAVQSGATVQAGTVIGYSGNTGYSKGPHLHYEIRVNGKSVDPNTYWAGKTVPLGTDSQVIQIPGSDFDEYERAQALWDMEAANQQDELDIINRTMEQRQLEYQSRMEVIERALYATERIRSQFASMYGDITDSESYVSRMNAAIDADIATRLAQIDNLYNELAVNGENYDWIPEITQQIDDLQNSIYDLQWEKLNNDLALFARRLQDIDDAVARLNTKLQLDSSLMSRNITKDYKISGGLTKEQYDQYYKNKEDWTWASQQRLNYDAASEEYAWLTSIMTAANQANIALRSLASTNLGFDVGDGWEAEILGVAQTLKAENVLVDNTVAKAQVMMKGYNDILWQTKQSQVELTAEVADLEVRLAEAIAAGNTEAKIESLARTLQEKRDALQSAMLDESEVHSEILGYLTDLTKYGYQEALEEETKLIDANLEAERKRHEEWLENRQEEQDLLKRRWEDEDQAKKIAEIDEDIAELEEKKANLDNDSSQYAAKLRQDYQKQIDELKKQKADAQLQYERSLQQREYDDEVKAENKAYDDFVEQSNEEKEALQEYYNNLIERAEAYVNGLYEAFGRSPQLTLGKLTELIPEISEAGRDAAEAYLTAFQEGLSLNTLTQRLNANDFGIDQSMLDTIPEAAQRKLIENSVDWLNLYMSGYSADNPILQALNKDSIGIRSKYGLDSDWLPQSLVDYRSTLFKDGKVSDMHDQAYLSNYGSYITKDGITQDQANEMVANSAKWHELQKEANLITQDGNLSIEQLDAANQSRLREIKAEQDALHNSSEQIRLQAKAFYESTGRVLENWETWMPTNGDPYAEYAKGENTTVLGEDAGVTTGSRAHGLTSEQVSKYKQNQANWMAWDAEKKTLASADNEYRWLQSIIDSAESTEGDKAWAKAEQAKYEEGWKRFNELLELQKQANQENISFRKIASANLGRALDDTWVPTFGDGGIVEGDGLAYLHKKEMVLPEVYANAIEFIADTLNTPRMHQVDKAASSSETKVEVREAVHIEHAQFNDEVDLELIEKRAGAKLKADLRSKGIR